MNLFGGATVQVDTYSNAAGSVITPHVLGDDKAIRGPGTTWDSVAANTRLVVSFGGMPLKNLQIEAGGTGEHSSTTAIRNLAGRGIEFVCISPIRADYADELKAEWLPAIPGTDTAIMLGLAHTLVTRRTARRGVSRTLHGRIRALPRATSWAKRTGNRRTPHWAARISGIDAETIRGLARRMAATRTFITTTWSLQRADHGEQPIWMTIVLAAMLGQIGLPGGGFGIGYGSVNRMGAGRSPAPTLNRPSAQIRSGRSFRSRASPICCSIPARPSTTTANGSPSRTSSSSIGAAEIRSTIIRTSTVWCGRGSVPRRSSSTKSGGRRPRATPTSCLPATTTLERNDIAASADRYMFAMHQAIAPVGEARNDFDIFADSGGRLGFRDAFTEGRTEMEWLRHLYEVARQQAARHGIERPDFETFWQTGYVADPAPRDYDFLADFRADPEGRPLKTPSGRIEIFSERVASFGYDDCPGHPAWIEPAEWLGSRKAGRFKLHLISNQPTLRLHSQLDNGPVSRAAKVQGREPLWINPRDAAARGISDGDVVRVFNERGACLAGAVVTDAVRPGVMQLQTGAWYDPGHARARRRARPARQSQHAHARQGDVETGAGSELTDRAGRGRALDRAGAGHRRIYDQPAIVRQIAAGVSDCPKIR